MKTYYIAAFVPEDEGNYSVYFPDFPGAVTGGYTIEECIEYGEDILEAVLQDLTAEKKTIPQPSSKEDVARMIRRIREEDNLPVSEAIHYQYFAAPVLDLVPVKVTISLPKHVLEETDKRAKAFGMNRSRFIADAAMNYNPAHM